MNPVFTFWACVWVDAFLDWQDCTADLVDMMAAEVIL